MRNYIGNTGMKATTDKNSKTVEKIRFCLDEQRKARRFEQKQKDK